MQFLSNIVANLIHFKQLQVWPQADSDFHSLRLSFKMMIERAYFPFLQGFIDIKWATFASCTKFHTDVNTIRAELSAEVGSK